MLTVSVAMFFVHFDWPTEYTLDGFPLWFSMEKTGCSRGDISEEELMR